MYVNYLVIYNKSSISNSFQAIKTKGIKYNRHNNNENIIKPYKNRKYSTIPGPKNVKSSILHHKDIYFLFTAKPQQGHALFSDTESSVFKEF